MATSNVMAFSLVPFGDAAPPIKVTGTIERTRTSLTIKYHLHDPKNLVKWPSESRNPSRKDNLWKTTCLEFFFSESKSMKYWEVNLSPSKDWNVYHFDGYREGMRQEAKISSIEIRPMDKTLVAIVPLAPFEIEPHATLELGVTAIVENALDGDQSFWALIHTTNQADFHRRDSFVIKI
ncbi:hypothetical protein MHU86_21788 [Fragilaria crotonensis]|nr:hypothetical protein MHU86_21788 [Fragilaria crotonensis]